MSRRLRILARLHTIRARKALARIVCALFEHDGTSLLKATEFETAGVPAALMPRGDDTSTRILAKREVFVERYCRRCGVVLSSSSPTPRSQRSQRYEQHVRALREAAREVAERAERQAEQWEAPWRTRPSQRGGPEEADQAAHG